MVHLTHFTLSKFSSVGDDARLGGARLDAGEARNNYYYVGGMKLALTMTLVLYYYHGFKSIVELLL